MLWILANKLINAQFEIPVTETTGVISVRYLVQCSFSPFFLQRNLFDASALPPFSTSIMRATPLRC